ncbi:MAG: fructose-bisphosphate aldolase class I [Actinomycetota bacterium]|nr:fructose-bisphosphate aldolase class I [Actinomycetota bacterium]
MVEPGRGILAADESNPTMNSRLDKVGLEATPEVRRNYREMLLTAADLDSSISGVILYDETVRQQAADGRPFIELVTAAGIIPGIKVDTGAKPLAGADGEKVTEGLDGLAERLEEYVGMGARFAKWRAVITIGNGLPSAKAVHVNAHALARYAALCQAAGLVPIVEPEVMMTGDHDLARCEQVTTSTLRAVFDELAAQDVLLEGMVLKPNMVVPGESAGAVPAEAVAEATLRCLYRSVPAAVPGIAFLSGGQSDGDATAHLQAMNSMGRHPWALTFSFGRALVSAALENWHGDPAHVDAGQQALLARARANAAASTGSYSGDLDRHSAAPV